MILIPIEFNTADLLSSDDAVAIWQVDGDDLKRLILRLHKAFGVIVAESLAGDHYLTVRAARKQEGNLVGDFRKLGQYGDPVLLKRSAERISAPAANVLVLRDGRAVAIRRTLTMASLFTHWALHGQNQMPGGYVRL